MPLDQIRPPWTAEQVAKLNRFQHYGFVHEYTCLYMHTKPCECGGHNPKCHLCLGGGAVLADRTLVATPDGWICPHCTYKQDWAHPMMLMAWIGPPDWRCEDCGEISRPIGEDDLATPVMCPKCAESALPK